MVMRVLSQNIEELVSANTTASTVTPLERLARTQALLLYQIIRLLDGDVTLRAQGEKDISLLQTWLEELCKIRNNKSGHDASVARVDEVQQPEDWQASTRDLLQKELASADGGIGLDLCGIAASDRRHSIFVPGHLQHDERHAFQRSVSSQSLLHDGQALTFSQTSQAPGPTSIAGPCPAHCGKQIPRQRLLLDGARGCPLSSVTMRWRSS